MMNTEPKKILAAGHICLDVIPDLPFFGEQLSSVLQPGCLVKIGECVTSTGGAVANTGLALHKLGAPVGFLAKVGSDVFGEALLGKLRAIEPSIAESMIVAADSHTSYTVVLNPVGTDRIFLHHPGANDTFEAGDVTAGHFREAGLMHFGYPPLMESFFRHDGREMRRLFAKAREAGLATSLDVSMPDPNAESGKIDWAGWLKNVLPETDIFLPSLDELAFMLRDCVYGETGSWDLKRALAEWCLEAGAGVLVLKCGSEGLYLRTAADRKRFARMEEQLGVSLEGEWAGRELAGSCFRVEEAGTTGAGDCTIAGFLDALRRGLSPEETLRFALAVGAFSVEAVDAASGIPARREVDSRLAGAWEQHSFPAESYAWNEADKAGIYRGPSDGK